MLRFRNAMSMTLVFAAALAWAGQPWKDKRAEQWDKHDVDQILRKSPWAQVITVPYSPTADVESGKGASIHTSPDRVDGDMNPRTAYERTWRPDGIFVLRWESSRTIRRALYRQAVLKGTQKPRSAEDSPQDDYELVMVPDSTVPFPEAEPAQLAAITYIQARPSGRKINASRVEFQQDFDTGRVTAVEFYFPRLTTDDKPVLSASDETIEFFSQVGPRVFQTRFHPKEMQTAEGPDL